jgi:hypothetical protein
MPGQGGISFAYEATHALCRGSIKCTILDQHTQLYIGYVVTSMVLTKRPVEAVSFCKYDLIIDPGTVDLGEDGLLTSSTLIRDRYWNQ